MNWILFFSFIFATGIMMVVGASGYPGFVDSVDTKIVKCYDNYNNEFVDEECIDKISHLNKTGKTFVTIGFVMIVIPLIMLMIMLLMMFIKDFIN